MNFFGFLVIAAASGFFALGYEILWYRAFSFANKSSPMTFALLLGAYLFGIAFGSLLSGSYCRKHPRKGDSRDRRAIAIVLFVAQLTAFFVLPALAWICAHSLPWVWALVPVAISTSFLGSSLPLIAHYGIDIESEVGRRVSFVYLANIVGSALGSLAVGYVFLDVWPLSRVALVVGALAILMATFVWVSSLSRKTWIPAMAFGVLIAAGFALATPRVYDRFWEKLLFKGDLDANFRFARTVETKSGVIHVTPGGEVYGGGAYDGIFNAGLRNDRNGIVRPYSLGAMRDYYENALMIGLASGSWAQVVVNLPNVRSLTVIEINPGYLKIIEENSEAAWLLRDPRVHIEIDDGRRWLQRHPEPKFDLVVMNTTWHWRAHITNLLSREYMEMVRTHLEPGGVFLFNTTHSEDAMFTAFSTFRYGMRVFNSIAVSDAPLNFDKARWQRLLTSFGIQGEPIFDPNRAEDGARIAELMAFADSISQAPTDEGLETKEHLLPRLQSPQMITDDNMVPEWRDPIAVQIAR